MDIVDSAGGLIDYRPWAHALEGPYTRMCKLAALNALPARHLCKLMFGKDVLTTPAAASMHGRSLLGGAWLREAEAKGAMAQSISHASLEHHCGPWARWIGSDRHLWYCPLCLDSCFQSVVHQVVGIEYCPAHGVALRSHCSQCGAPTPAYAVEPAALDLPMHCPQCQNAYAPAWQPGAFLTAALAPIPERAFAGVIRWLELLEERSLDWTDLAGWLPTHDPDPLGDETKRSIHDALKVAFPDSATPPNSAMRLVASDVCEAGTAHLSLFSPPELLTERIATYKAIRRAISRRLRKSELKPWTLMCAYAIDTTNGTVLPKRPGQDVRIHALLLWRKRFERTFDPFAPNVRRTATSIELPRLMLYGGMLSWPIGWKISIRSWGHFVFACYRADLQTCTEWAEVAKPHLTELATLASWKEERQAVKTRYLSQVHNWLPWLSPKSSAWPPALAYFTGRQGPHHELKLHLIVSEHGRSHGDLPAPGSF